MGLRGVGVLLTAVALSSGCGGTCTSIGCVDGVEIMIDREFAVDLLPVEIRTCVDDVCRIEKIEAMHAAPGRDTFGIGPGIQLDAREERTVDVSLDIRSLATGEILVSARGKGHLRRAQPNGGGCPPICFGTVLRLDESAGVMVDG